MIIRLQRVNLGPTAFSDQRNSATWAWTVEAPDAKRITGTAEVPPGHGALRRVLTLLAASEQSMLRRLAGAVRGLLREMPVDDGPVHLPPGWRFTGHSWVYSAALAAKERA